MRWKRIILFIVLGFPSLFIISFRLLNQLVFSLEILINATVKVSICGNNIIEGGENCEGDDLAGASCQSLGYGGGTLKCDIACSFDTSDCLPTPTPTPTPTPPAIPTATATPVPTQTLLPTPTPQTTSTPTPLPTPILPLPVAVFDIDGSGRIEMTEVFATVKAWVEEWQAAIAELAQPGALVTRERHRCDLDRDGECDLVDLSILLYYIGK